MILLSQEKETKMNMKKILLIWCISFAIMQNTLAQDSPSIYKISTELLAGEGLAKMEQSDPSRKVYQRKVYDGEDIAVFMVAIGTGITNEFQGFPMEEFIFWMNGKALVEPAGEDSFPIYSGDYFIQAKGFHGKWNFIDIGGLHLELALIAKNRPDSTFKSPMTKALVIDRDILSGVTMPADGVIYEGPELTLKVLTSIALIEKVSRERMIHVLNGVLTITTKDKIESYYHPGDFFIIPKGFDGTFSTNSLQELRVLEVFKTKIK